MTLRAGTHYDFISSLSSEIPLFAKKDHIHRYRGLGFTHSFEPHGLIHEECLAESDCIFLMLACFWFCDQLSPDRLLYTLTEFCHFTVKIHHLNSLDKMRRA